MFSTIYNNLTRKLAPTSMQTATMDELFPHMVGQQQRNEARMAQIKAEMGDKYLLHPKHAVKKLKRKSSV